MFAPRQRREGPPGPRFDSPQRPGGRPPGGGRSFRRRRNKIIPLCYHISSIYIRTLRTTSARAGGAYHLALGAT
ncbi:hypothetical protein EVAR_47653_1 [Eumeta japonica]|uniref:Uncharacterized protein n=1 Tax=Eumeta variegata TaxID=151549 RepID=A0A4C1XYG8_EUMVA|nr:hypothetical protein EVAR_47653_1 [Eumeta japonica]